MPTIENTANSKGVYLQSLLEIYPESKLLQGDSSTLIKDMTGLKNVKPHSLAFIKNRSFFKRFLEAKKKEFDLKSLSLVLEKSFFDSLEETERKELEGLGNLIMAPSVDEAICLFSKPFYDLFISFEMEESRSKAAISEKALISPQAFIGPNVSIEQGVQVMPGVKILGDAHIGEGSILFPNVVIYPRTQIGKFCRIHAHTTIGADGFGYNFIRGEHLKVWHFGGVLIADNVEIGANSCVDAGVFEPTRIGEGTRIDNHVQIAHNCQVGNHVVICGQSALGGSSALGDYSALGGKSGLGPGVSLGAASQLGGGSLANRNWPDGSVIAGYPAFEVRTWLRSVAQFKKLGQRKSS